MVCIYNMYIIISERVKVLLFLAALLSIFIFANAGQALADKTLNVNSSITGVSMTGTYPGHY